jgi:hypothetical protein
MNLKIVQLFGLAITNAMDNPIYAIMGLSEKSIESTLGSALFSVFRVQKNRPFL